MLWYRQQSVSEYKNLSTLKDRLKWGVTDRLSIKTQALQAKIFTRMTKISREDSLYCMHKPFLVIFGNNLPALLNHRISLFVCAFLQPTGFTSSLWVNGEACCVPAGGVNVFIGGHTVSTFGNDAINNLGRNNYFLESNC